ncbi:hypothetical protein Nepgr_031658 [Nepenthes gracilis]|uniref:Uncharacterized protein n=1 Tax=Nepenthes gracilis TaxID=150966 RepID=A0AAD3THS6_NEPGR|nr:hypothetical protein Nepgr_031658 [Nepenthes gracilis]
MRTFQNRSFFSVLHVLAAALINCIFGLPANQGGDLAIAFEGDEPNDPFNTNGQRLGLISQFQICQTLLESFFWKNGFGGKVVAALVATAAPNMLLLHLLKLSFKRGLGLETPSEKDHSNPITFQYLKSLNSQASVYVAEPQAKLIISILSSNDLSLPHDSYPLLFRLLYIWIRKSTKPSLELIDSAVSVIFHTFSQGLIDKRSIHLVSESVLLLGAFSAVATMAESTKKICLELIFRLLEEEEECKMIGLVRECFPRILAGIGYALSSSRNTHFVKLLNYLFGIWGNLEGARDISHGLMILHLIEWLLFGIIDSRSLDKIEDFISEIFENSNTNYASFAVLMAAAGALRVSNSLAHNGGPLVISRLRFSADSVLEAVAIDLTSRTEGGFLLQCFSLAIARCGGPISSRGPRLICLASALLSEIFPLKRFYATVLQNPLRNFRETEHNEVKKHHDSIIFKEAGAVTGAFCSLYSCGKEEDKFFALAVTKERLSSNVSRERQIDVSVKILVSFSCIEFFRRVRLPEYMDTIQAAVVSVQENEFACLSFVESIPSYGELTRSQEFSSLQKKYMWTEDEVQTARILFYLRVIPTSIERLSTTAFRTMVASTMFLYMGHPNVKVARASHSLFASFLSSGKNYDQDERASLKEQLVYYYMMRSLEAYPGNTPFDGLVSGVIALVRQLPAGSPSVYYCIHGLVNKASDLMINWHGDSEPCKKVFELLVRLLSLVDIQVLSELMKLLAGLTIRLPKDGQNIVLDDLYALVAELDDVTRKPALVSWLTSLSYLCSQGLGGSLISTDVRSEENIPITARL